MKTRLLIITGIVIATALSLTSYTIYDSSTTVFISCDPKYEQIGDKCILLNPESYCKDWCNVEELSQLGCDRLVLDYIFRATNIIDGKPGEPYYWNWIGMPEGLSEEEFESCSDILKEKRIEEFQPHPGLGMLNQDESTPEPEPELSEKIDQIPTGYFCANIGFAKYPDNLFVEFLENPYNKDVTFLNFTHDDFESIPEFYDLVLEAGKMDYPLNDRVYFDLTTEELIELKEYMNTRPYSKFVHSGETLEDQLSYPDIDGNYRHPNILIDGKLYEINGLNFSPIVAGQTETLNIHLEGTLDEMKDWFIEQNNPNNLGIYYYKINESDKIPLASILDAVEQIHKSQDKIRLSEDVGGKIQDKTMDFFLEQNMIQFDNDESKHTKYFVLNGTMYELSFVVC